MGDNRYSDLESLGDQEPDEGETPQATVTAAAEAVQTTPEPTTVPTNEDSNPNKEG
jgi:hypothetical protein